MNRLFTSVGLMVAAPFVMTALSACVQCEVIGSDRIYGPGHRLDSLQFLTGQWQGSAWGGTLTAWYSEPSDGRLVSYTFLERDSERAFHEFELFEAAGAGAITLRPHPGGTPATPLTLTSLERNKAVFENPEKDYPTRIVYECTAEGRLVITLDDPHNGAEKREIFDLAPVVNSH